MSKDINYEVKDEQMESTLKRLGSLIAGALPRNWGFTLFLFSFGEGGDLFYISSAQREDTIKMLKEYIAKEERRMKN